MTQQNIMHRSDWFLLGGLFVAGLTLGYMFSYYILTNAAGGYVLTTAAAKASEKSQVEKELEHHIMKWIVEELKKSPEKREQERGDSARRLREALQDLDDSRRLWNESVEEMRESLN